MNKLIASVLILVFFTPLFASSLSADAPEKKQLAARGYEIPKEDSVDRFTVADIGFARIFFWKSDERFDCNGTGLVLKNNKMLFGTNELFFCKKQGVVSLYKEDCNIKNNYTLWFDEVSRKLVGFNPDTDDTISLFCTKIKRASD